MKPIVLSHSRQAREFVIGRLRSRWPSRHRGEILIVYDS